MSQTFFNLPLREKILSLVLFLVYKWCPVIFLCGPVTIVEIDFLLLCCFSPWLCLSLFLCFTPPPRPFLHCPLLFGYYLISSSGSNHHPSCILCLPPLWFFPCHLSLPAPHVFLPLPFHPPFLTLTGCMTGKYALQQGQANRLAICLYK